MGGSDWLSVLSLLNLQLLPRLGYFAIGLAVVIAISILRFKFNATWLVLLGGLCCSRTVKLASHDFWQKLGTYQQHQILAVLSIEYR